jgi:urease accessory protein
MMSSIARLGAGVGIATLAMQTPAFAHHVMGGKMPETFLQGLLSGLGHPVIGIDHLAAIVGAGLLVALAQRGVAPLFAFSGALIAGVALHLGRMDLPVSELLVGLSTIAVGVLVVLRQSMGPAIAAFLFAIVGLLHGYALGESIVGAEPAPLVAYLAGLLIIQTAIAFAAYALLARLPARGLSMTIAGIVVVLAGGMTAAAATGLVG